jgi:hypothetical protein
MRILNQAFIGTTQIMLLYKVHTVKIEHVHFAEDCGIPPRASGAQSRQDERRMASADGVRRKQMGLIAYWGYVTDKPLADHCRDEAAMAPIPGRLQ